MSATNAASPTVSRAYGARSPNAQATPAAIIPAARGSAKRSRRLRQEAVPQGSAGPTPIRKRIAAAMGIPTWLNQGAPTLILPPPVASTTSGNRVPNSTVKVRLRKSRLLNRNADSRLTRLSMRPSSWSSGRRHTSSDRAAPRLRAIAARKNGPIADWVKEWTLKITPERVRKVPSRVSSKVAMMSVTVQIFSVRRRSATMLEWMKAVAVSHGMSDAFSTGSQPQ